MFGWVLEFRGGFMRFVLLSGSLVISCSLTGGL